MHSNPFSDAELNARVARLLKSMADRGIDIALISAPENIFYLIGLDHWGYFAPHLLVVPADGDLVLITRQMERVAIANMVRNAEFIGHSDSESVAEAAIRVLRGRCDGLTIGTEDWSSGLAFGVAAQLRSGLKPGEWRDVTGMVDELRLVKSAEEQALMRRAARASDAAMAAAIGAVADGAREADVAAECLAAMTRAGSTPPGFGPFIRPEARIAEEHTSWGTGIYRRGERVMLELAGCVSRYHAPLGRLVSISSMSDDDAAMAEIAKAAFSAVVDKMKPGVHARDVYASWQSVVDDAGMPHYRRHHCGYVVGIGFPPSWTGGNSVIGLRNDSDMLIQEGMTFHVLSWFTNTGRGSFFLSDTVLVGADWAETLTTVPAGPTLV